MRPLVAALVLVGAWTALTVTNRDGQGFALWELIAISALDGATAGTFLGVVAFLVAQNRGDTPNLLDLLVVIPWLVAGAVAFALVGLIVTFGRQTATAS